MKKLILPLLLLGWLSQPARSQSGSSGETAGQKKGSPPRFGVIAGVSFAKLSTKSSGITFTTSTLTSFHAGFLMGFALPDNIYFQPQLLLSGKGGKINIAGTEGSTNPFYLEIPLNFLYKVPAGPGKIFGGLGPYAAFGLFGKSKSKDQNQSVSRKLSFGSGDQDDLRVPDFGANFLVGYELPNGFLINVNYSLGVSNVLPGASSGQAKGKNHYFGLSVGYLLAGK